MPGDFDAILNGAQQLERLAWINSNARKALESGMWAGTTLAVNQGKLNAPVDTGRYRASITNEVRWESATILGVIGSNVFYAVPIEYGTGALGDPEVPHVSIHWPPGGALSRWASRHGMPNGFVVARAIGKRGGLAPRRVLRSAIFTPFMQNNIFNAIKAAVDQFWGRAGGE